MPPAHTVHRECYPGSSKADGAERGAVHQLRHSLQNKDTWNLVADSSGFETAFAHSD